MAGSRSESEELRVDKWLWAARFFKTRSSAAAAVSGGKVHVDGQRVKPSKLVRIDTVLSIRRGETEWTVLVRGINAKRRPAPEAVTLYEELPESIAAREAARESHRAAAEARAIRSGRPTKRERRQISVLKGQS